MATTEGADWYIRYGVEKPNANNNFNFVPDYITRTWPVPNYTDPESRVHITHITESLTLALACLAVALRLYSRMSASKRLFPEDYVIVAALLLAAVKSFIVLVSTSVGFGLHRWDIPTDNFRILNKYYTIGIVFYLGSVMLTKASIILRYRRMFPPEVTKIRKVSHIIVFGFFALFAAITILMMNTCHPVPSVWRPEQPGKCVNTLVLYVCNISGNFIVDFAIYVLPLPYLWRLTLPRRQRINLLVIFGLGFSVCCVALVELVVAVNLHRDGYFDWTWKGPILWACTAFELLFALTAASLPDLKTLIAKFLPRLLSSSRGSSDNHDMEAAGVDCMAQANNVAITNPAAFSPALANPHRNSNRLSKPYWLRSQLNGSLFSISTSRRGSAVPNAEEDGSTALDSGAGEIDLEKTTTNRANEKRVTMISEEDSASRATETMMEKSQGSQSISDLTSTISSVEKR